MCLDNRQYHEEQRIVQNIPRLESIWYLSPDGKQDHMMRKERPGEGNSQATVSLEDTLPAWLSMAVVGVGAAGLVRLPASVRLFSGVAAWCLCSTL